MKIEEDIKQSRFKDNYQRMIVNLLYSANWMRDEQIKILKPFGLLHQHYNVLRILKGKHPEPVSPGDIKKVMIDKANDLTRLIDKLEKQKLVKRNLCPSNHRKMDIVLTKAGMDVLDKTTRELDNFVTTIKKNIPDKEAERLSRLLDKMRG